MATKTQAVLWTPNKLTIDIPLEYELLACRLKVRRESQTKFLNLKCDVNEHQAVVNDEELNLKNRDVLEYSLLYRDYDNAYLETGIFKFREGKHTFYNNIFNKFE